MEKSANPSKYSIPPSFQSVIGRSGNANIAFGESNHSYDKSNQNFSIDDSATSPTLDSRRVELLIVMELFFNPQVNSLSLYGSSGNIPNTISTSTALLIDQPANVFVALNNSKVVMNVVSAKCTPVESIVARGREGIVRVIPISIFGYATSPGTAVRKNKSDVERENIDKFKDCNKFAVIFGVSTPVFQSAQALDEKKYSDKTKSTSLIRLKLSGSVKVG